MPKVRLAVRISERRKEKVKTLAKEWDTTETEVIERAIDTLPEPRNTDESKT